MLTQRDVRLKDYPLPPAVLASTLSPALVIFRAQVRRNLSWMVERLGGAERWRPHVKTAKIPAIFAEYCRLGVRQFKCATTREAHYLVEELAQGGGGDVLVAYPHVGPALERLVDLARRHPSVRLSVLCEDEADAQRWPQPLGLFVDLNPGMNRTGIPLAESRRILRIAQHAGPRFCGVHFYEGHVHHPDLEVRRRQAEELYVQLGDVLALLDREGVAVPEVVTSGTPAFLLALESPTLAALPMVHRLSPGTVVYHDLRSAELLPGIPLRPAALVLSRVISRPAEDVVTCDAGSKSLAAESGDPVAAVVGHPELEALTPSEEHLPLRCPPGGGPARGTPLLLVPRHVCPTVNLAEQALLVEEDGSFEAVAVSARAHDLT